AAADRRERGVDAVLELGDEPKGVELGAAVDRRDELVRHPGGAPGEKPRAGVEEQRASRGAADVDREDERGLRLLERDRALHYPSATRAAPAIASAEISYSV